METPSTAPRFLSKYDLAHMFGVTPRTIQNWMQKGRIPAPLPLGGRILRWHPQTIERFAIQPGCPTPAAR